MVVRCVMRDGTEDEAEVLADQAPAWFLRKKPLPFPDMGIIDVVFRQRAPGLLIYDETTEDPKAVVRDSMENNDHGLFTTAEEFGISAGAGEQILSTLKDDINKFAYSKVPDMMTILEFERLTCTIHDVISQAWRKAHPEIDIP
jgi:hypothetical protein